MTSLLQQVVGRLRRRARRTAVRRRTARRRRSAPRARSRLKSDAGAPGHRDQAAPVRVGAVNRGLHERRIGDRPRRPLGLDVGRAAGHVDGDQLGRPFAAAHDPDRQRLADLARAPRRSRSNSLAVMVTPLAPLASANTQSLVEHSPSTVIALNVTSVDGRQRALQQRRLDLRVGRDDAQHGRHQRLDHPRALGDAADAEACRPASSTSTAASFGKRIGRHDRARRGRAAVARRATVAAAAMPSVDRCRSSDDADHAGGRDQHLRRIDAGGARRRVGHRFRASGSPSGPVQALAQPLLITTTRECPPEACSRAFETSTGAATALLVVNTAALDAGRSLTISARSSAVRLLDAAGDARRAEARRRGDAAVDRREHEIGLDRRAGHAETGRSRSRSTLVRGWATDALGRRGQIEPQAGAGAELQRHGVLAAVAELAAADAVVRDLLGHPDVRHDREARGGRSATAGG